MNRLTVKACRFITLLLLSLNTVIVNSVELPSYIVILPSDSVPLQLNDSSLWENAYPVYFKCNKAFIPQEDSRFTELSEVLKNLSKDYGLCKLMVIRSSASPEGSYANNVSLSHRRASALVTSLRKHIIIPDSTVEERYIHEDYEGLRRMLLQSDAPFRNKVIAVIEQYRGNDREIKRHLKAIDAGKVWRTLLHDYYPRLRAARILIFVTRNLDSDIGLVARDLMPATDFNPKEELSPPQLLNISDEMPKRSKGLPIINLKTNLLYDLACFIPRYGWAPTPNVSLEFLPRSGHLTAVAEYVGSGWRSDQRLKTWIVRDLLLEGRYYFRGQAAFTGHYLSAYANTARYDIQFSAEKAWLSKDYGDTWGGGIGWGYVRRIGKSPWKWEVNVAAGFLHTDYDHYHPAEEWATEGKFYYNWHESPEKFVKLRNKFNYIGITRLGFSISYDLPWLRWKQRKGGGQ